MLTSELDYHLPPELIAQQPAFPRDASRLLVYDRESGKTAHRRLPDLLEYLAPGDILVYNDSRVIPARLHLVKATGGGVELLFLRRRDERLWEVLARPSARLREQTLLYLPRGRSLDVAPAGTPLFRLESYLGEGRWLVTNVTTAATQMLLEELGEMPLPPYITQKLEEEGRYQTVYAETPGSAAAPTAGLHFTPELMARIETAGIAMYPVTLHIGLDTFRPVSEEDLQQHTIHTEHYRMPQRTCEAVTQTHCRGGKVTAVGTTSVRVLETAFAGPGRSLEGETGLFITPGFEFHAVDRLLTNFHLPRSTLLALVMAFAGQEQTRRIYEEAVREKYRFYSFGDALLIL